MPAASNTPTLNRALAVGLLVAVAGGVFLVAFTFFRKGGLAAPRQLRRSRAVFDDVTGLSWKSRVQMAGIQVGEVTEIELSGERARVDHPGEERHPAAGQRLPDQALPVGAPARRAARGQRWARPRAAAPRPSGRRSGEITCVREAANVAKLMESLSKIAGRHPGGLGRPGEDGRRHPGERPGDHREPDPRHPLRRSAARREHRARWRASWTTPRPSPASFAPWPSRTPAGTTSIARNVDEASQRLNRILASVEDIVGPGQTPELKESVQGARQALQKLNKTLDDVAVGDLQGGRRAGRGREAARRRAARREGRHGRRERLRLREPHLGLAALREHPLGVPDQLRRARGPTSASR